MTKTIFSVVSGSRLLFAAAGVVAVAATAGGVAYATIAGSDTVYSACVLRGVGQMRLIDKSLPSTNPMSRCTDKETEISWNQAGQPGPQGLPGNLALAGRSCPEGAFVTGFDRDGDLVCAAPGGGGGGGGGGEGEPGAFLVSPLRVDFPPTAVGTASDAAIVTVTNTGPVEVAVTITLSEVTDFVANGCRVIPVHGACDISVRFTPSGVGSRTTFMTVQGSNGERVVISLSGAGV